MRADAESVLQLPSNGQFPLAVDGYCSMALTMCSGQFANYLQAMIS